MKITTARLIQGLKEYPRLLYICKEPFEIVFETDATNAKEMSKFFRLVSDHAKTSEIENYTRSYQFAVSDDFCCTSISAIAWLNIRDDFGNIYILDHFSKVVDIKKNGLSIPFGLEETEEETVSKYREQKMKSRVYAYLSNQLNCR